MIEFVVYAAAAASCAGAIVVAAVSIGSRQEDHAATLRGAPPGLVAAAARRITGLYVRMPGQPAAQPANAGQQVGDSQCRHVGEACGMPGAGLGEARL